MPFIDKIVIMLLSSNPTECYYLRYYPFKPRLASTVDRVSIPRQVQSPPAWDNPPLTDHAGRWMNRVSYFSGKFRGIVSDLGGGSLCRIYVRMGGVGWLANMSPSVGGGVRDTLPKIANPEPYIYCMYEQHLIPVSLMTT